jgi:hypothetical protein
MGIRIAGRKGEVSSAVILISNRKPFCGLTTVGYYYALRISHKFAFQFWSMNYYTCDLFTYLEMMRHQTDITRQDSHSISYLEGLNFKFLPRVYLFCLSSVLFGFLRLLGTVFGLRYGIWTWNFYSKCFQFIILY